MRRTRLSSYSLLKLYRQGGKCVVLLRGGDSVKQRAQDCSSTSAVKGNRQNFLLDMDEFVRNRLTEWGLSEWIPKFEDEGVD
ncbi:nuclear GTPase SLIP-GC-like isoform X1 [Lates japonicus]|uniref:Nuclear GTPase SLIP-GC-like isoform X1 n=1 Tax=Lates japonicus TaxID=270547 RepID=A0AAD3RHD0_LATJO|nr:nuclear GTPase SLIP-GC-like isoform X1 [Lates japonicus]